MPAFDNSRRGDEAYIQGFYAERSQAKNRKAVLIGALYRADPDNPALATLLPRRWDALASMVRDRNYSRTLGQHLTAELNEVIAAAKSDGMKKDAAYWKAQVAGFSRFVKASAPKRKAIDEFIALDPKDERGAELLFFLSDSLEDEPAEQRALYSRIVKEYPDSQWGRLSEGTLRRLDTVGKPFDLEFTEARSGSEISIKGLKGKVVIIDFWATWCGPCVAEMPALKKLYAEYKDKGVEFIGVSLDNKEGGLEALKAFVTKEGISWPQYFQGDGWESKFSASWGINGIPAVFVVDQEGKLFSIEARGQLETMIPDLLNRRPSKPGGDGGR
jgi:thiol-disulfide isomerase/thioredoxin